MGGGGGSTPREDAPRSSCGGQGGGGRGTARVVPSSIITSPAARRVEQSPPSTPRSPGASRRAPPGPARPPARAGPAAGPEEGSSSATPSPRRAGRGAKAEGACLPRKRRGAPPAIPRGDPVRPAGRPALGAGWGADTTPPSGCLKRSLRRVGPALRSRRVPCLPFRGNSPGRPGVRPFPGGGAPKAGVGPPGPGGGGHPPTSPRVGAPGEFRGGRAAPGRRPPWR